MTQSTHKQRFAHTALMLASAMLVGGLGTKLWAQSIPPLSSPPPVTPTPPGTPFCNGDWSWLNGSNREPNSLLTMGPLTWSLYVDTFYGWQNHHPIDDTVFLTTVAP